MGITEIVGLLLSVVDGVLKKLPDYSQRKKETYFKLRQSYEQELLKDFPNRDDELIILKRMELLEFIRTFQSEIQ